MTRSETVTIELDLKPINPKKQRREPTADDFASSYVIAIKRNDGRGVSEEEADMVLMSWLMNRNATRRRKATK